MGFSKLGLSDSILKAIKQQGYDKPSPIQEKSIPIVLDGKDLTSIFSPQYGQSIVCVCSLFINISVI